MSRLALLMAGIAAIISPPLSIVIGVILLVRDRSWPLALLFVAWGVFILAMFTQTGVTMTHSSNILR